MPCDSNFEIPKAAVSDKNMAKDPYVADAYESPYSLYHREQGTPQFVVKARVARCFSPKFVENLPGKLNENTPETDISALDVTRDVTNSCYLVTCSAKVQSGKVQSGKVQSFPLMGVPRDTNPATDAMVG